MTFRVFHGGLEQYTRAVLHPVEGGSRAFIASMTTASWGPCFAVLDELRAAVRNGTRSRPKLWKLVMIGAYQRNRPHGLTLSSQPSPWHALTILRGGGNRRAMWAFRGEMQKNDAR